MHELSLVRPGAALDYLAAVREGWAPVRAEYGHRLVGLWEVLLGDTEVCTLWATDLEAHVGLARATDAARGFPNAGLSADDRLTAWPERRHEFCERFREELLIPCPGTPMGPDAWAT